MRRFVPAAFLAAFALALSACVAPPKPRSQAYIVDSQGTVSAGTRSALDGTPAPGRQELIALYIPPMPGLPGAPDFRAGVTVDPSVLQFPIIITPPLAAQAAPAPYAAPCATSTTRTVMVPEQYSETIMVPQTVTKTRMVPRTETVPAVTVPVPQAAPKGPCDPMPPVSKVDDNRPAIVAEDCPDGACHDPRLMASTK